MNRQKINVMKILKIALGSFLSSILATVLGLKFPTSAGILTLLTIQDTKKETLLIALRRFGAFFLAMILASFLFTIYGYYANVFGLFLLVFSILCYLLQFQDGLSTSAVLTTHLLLEKSVGLKMLVNELFLLLIGIGVGVILNLFMPKTIEEIKKKQQCIESQFKHLLIYIADSMILITHNQKFDELFVTLDQTLDEAIEQSYANMNNTLWTDTKYYHQYTEMRKNQAIILKRIAGNVHALELVTKQTEPIHIFLIKIAASFHEYNDASALLLELQKLQAMYSNDSLPTTRQEFENRARLYLLLDELKEFLLQKKEFVETLTTRQIEKYWNTK